ncbi:penicillin-binding protein 2 [Patescibacteria group bacterium]|nr:penicillin-binding protein 2 [Patescibacteria group bacterium]
MLGLKKYFVKYRDRESIEAEEIFLDTEAVRSIEEKGKLEQPIKNRNFVLFYILITICLVSLFLRAGYLQIVKGDYYQDLSQGNRLRIYPISAPRGMIYDYQGRPLVYNIPSFDLVVSLNDFFDNSVELQEEILEKITDIVTEPDSAEVGPLLRSDLIKKIEDAHGKVSQVVLLKGIERSAALILETLVNQWPGFRLEKNAQRQYLTGSYFSHIIGYTGQVNSADLEDNSDYYLNDQIGKDGLEFFYEEFLRGESGQEQIEVDSLGKTQRLLAVKSAKPGLGLILHLDKDLQIKLSQSLESILKKIGSWPPKRKATAIMVDPRNGGILALVSLPSFDNNLFAQGISQEELDDLENDLSNPFLNRALAGQYPSGSIIKPLIAAAALEEEIVTPYQSISCSGVISIVNQYNPEIVYRFPDWKVHGPTNLIEAIAQSCNVFFYTVGGGYGNIEGLGVERIKKYLEYFGLGQLTGIDLPHEEIGLVPNGQDEDWYLGDTYHLSIGQGDILVTPLQMVMALASIANGGTLYQPQIVNKIVDLYGNLVKDIPAQIINQGFINPGNIEAVQKGMRQAVISGSAVALASLPVEVAGKTGTAQFGKAGSQETHSWFIGYAPYDQPEVVIIVLVEAGGEGHKTALPVAKEVLEWYFNNN